MPEKGSSPSGTCTSEAPGGKIQAQAKREMRLQMKVVLLAGGRGSRLSEETQSRPKPMVEIGGHPILWHIMMMYWSHGFREFIICLGYRGYFIKEYFANFVLHRCDVTF